MVKGLTKVGQERPEQEVVVGELETTAAVAVAVGEGRVGEGGKDTDREEIEGDEREGQSETTSEVPWPLVEV